MLYLESAIKRNAINQGVPAIFSFFIISGTTTFILSKIVLEGLLFIQVLSEHLPATALGSVDTAVDKTDNDPRPHSVHVPKAERGGEQINN